jgi:hypothetical protein
MLADRNVAVIVPNTQANLDAIVANWQEAAKHPKLQLIFVNPYSNTEKKWLLMPHVHERVSDRKTLKLGLQSLFSSVEEFR